MPNTPNRGYWYPALSAANDPPRDLQLLADGVDADVNALMTANPVPPEYQTGWGDYNPTGGTTQGVLATRSAAGLVGLSGMFARIGATITPATLAEQQVLVLPEGYRPGRQILLPMLASLGSGGAYANVRVDIYPDGRLSARWIQTAQQWLGGTGGAAAWVSLSGVSYVAAS